MAMLFDSHTHLNSDSFQEDFSEIIERIIEGGIGGVMNVGFDLPSSELAVEQAELFDWCWCSVGCHPSDVDTMDDKKLERLRELSSHPKVKAIGEIGLDYHWDDVPPEIQREWFRKQIRLAKEVGLPVIIHSRDAPEETMNILKEEEAFETGVLMHCFSGSAELGREYIKLGAMISIPGTVTFKNNRKQVQVAEELPLDRLMVETDAPYLTPVPFRGKRNEPSYVRYTAEKVAEIRGLSFEEVAEATNRNARAFFGI